MRLLRVLAIGAHPDDVEVYCGGTLARCALRGDHTFMLACTDGGGGHQLIPPEQLVPIRAEEARAAAEALGARLLLLNEPDGALFAGADSRRRIREVFADIRPELVLAHPPSDYHPDHRAAAELAEAACALRHIPLLYMDTPGAVDFVPDLHVELPEEALDRKLRAVACHRSQVDWLRHHDGIDLVEWVRAATRARGLHCGAQYAEGFRLAPGTGLLRAASLLP